MTDDRKISMRSALFLSDRLSGTGSSLVWQGSDLNTLCHRLWSHCVDCDRHLEACRGPLECVPDPILEEIPDVAERHHAVGLHLKPAKRRAAKS